MFKRLTEKGPDNRETRRPSSVRELCEVAGASRTRELRPVIEVFRRFQAIVPHAIMRYTAER